MCSLILCKMEQKDPTNHLDAGLPSFISALCIKSNDFLQYAY